MAGIHAWRASFACHSDAICHDRAVFPLLGSHTLKEDAEHSGECADREQCRHRNSDDERLDEHPVVHQYDKSLSSSLHLILMQDAKDWQTWLARRTGCSPLIRTGCVRSTTHEVLCLLVRYSLQVAHGASAHAVGDRTQKVGT